MRCCLRRPISVSMISICLEWPEHPEHAGEGTGGVVVGMGTEGGIDCEKGGGAGGTRGAVTELVEDCWAWGKYWDIY